MSEHVVKAGDVVRLKSGGPRLTVLWVAGDIVRASDGGIRSDVWCLRAGWFKDGAFLECELSLDAVNLLDENGMAIPRALPVAQDANLRVAQGEQSA